MDNYVLPKKEYKPLDKKDFAFLFVYFVSSFLMVNMAIVAGFHLGFTVAYFILFCATTAYLFDKSKKVSVFTILCGLLSLVGSVTFSLFNDYLVNFIMFVLVCGLYVVYSLGLSNAFMYHVGSFKMLIDVAKDALVHPFMSLGDVFGGIKVSAKKGKKSLAGLVGVAVAIPFVLIIGALLMSSDAAFEGLITKVFKNIGIYLLQLLVAIIIMPYIYSNAFGKRNGLNRIDYGKNVKIKSAPVSACVSFLVMISVVYVVYLFSQLAYFFSAFKGILPDGYKYTASAFARRGFFEMFAICAINIVVISIVTAIVKRRSCWVKVLSCFISLFSVLLIITALQKMKLNMSIYGLTKNRLFVTVFMLMMLVVIFFFIVHIFAPKISYMQPIIIICSCMFIALSFADIDTQIAKYNIDAYSSGAIDTLDMDIIGDLSDSAVPYTVKLTESDNPEIASHAMRICGDLYSSNYKSYFDTKNNKKPSVWSYSLANQRAVLAIDDAKYSKEISSIAQLYDKEYVWYDDDIDCFTEYTDSGWNKDGRTEMYYNPETRMYDDIHYYNSNNDEVFESKEHIIYSSKDKN